MDKSFYVVGIGASAGGHKALEHFFSHLPANFPAALVVVTHLYRSVKSELTRIISRFTPLKVVRVQNHMRVEAGNVYVMPENVIMLIQDGTLILSERPVDQVANNAINIFFESLAVDQQEKAIGVILSGMGFDGATGALKIFENGGDVYVQDPETTAFNSMPLAAIMKDHPDFILPPEKLGEKLTHILKLKKMDRAPVEKRVR